MTIDTRTPEGRDREMRNAALGLAKKMVDRALAEASYMIMTTHTGERRNIICDANIHLLAAQNELEKLSAEVDEKG